MTGNILAHIKKLLGVDSSQDEFDTDIKLHINSVLAILYQLGSAPQGAVFQLVSGDEKWEDFIQNKLEVMFVISYIYISVRLIFDPPQTSFQIAALERQRDELAWRLQTLEDLFLVPQP